MKIRSKDNEPPTIPELLVMIPIAVAISPIGWGFFVKIFDLTFKESIYLAMVHFIAFLFLYTITNGGE